MARKDPWGGYLKSGGLVTDQRKAGARKGEVRDDVSKCVEILETATTVEIKWQDGSVEGGLRTVVSR